MHLNRRAEKVIAVELHLIHSPRQSAKTVVMLCVAKILQGDTSRTNKHMASFVVGTMPGGCEGRICSVHGIVDPRGGLWTVNGDGAPHQPGDGSFPIPSAGQRSNSGPNAAFAEHSQLANKASNAGTGRIPA